MIDDLPAWLQPLARVASRIDDSDKIGEPVEISRFLHESPRVTVNS